jgi:hypothetical protein
MAILRKPALTAARAGAETKSGVIGRREQMSWSNEYLERSLFQSFFVSGSGRFICARSGIAAAFREAVLHFAE